MIKSWLNRQIDSIQKNTNIDVRYFVHSGSWSLISDGVQMIAGVMLAVLFARLASKEVFGQFQLIVSVIALLAVVSVKGLDIVILRDTARGLDGVYRKAVKLRFWWSLIGIPMMLAVGLYYGMRGESTLALAFYIGAWLLPIHYSVASWPGWLKGKRRFDIQGRHMLAKSVINLIVVATAIVTSAGSLVAVFVSYLVGQIIVNGIIYGMSWRLAKNERVSRDWKKYGYFISLTGLFKLIVANIDKVLVAVLISPAALAVYAIAILIPNYFQIAIKSLFQTASPRLSKRKYLSFKELGIVLGLGIVITAVNLVAVKVLLIPLFGESYQEALGLAYIASLGMIFHPTAQYLVNFANMSEKKKAILISNTVGPAIKLLLLIILVSLWQAVGFVAVYSIMSLVWVVALMLTMKINWRKRLVG